MKTNEAPKKLYISNSELNDSEHCVIWFKSQQNENDIEYIRKDAFIEKAVKWLMDNIQDYTDDGMGEHSFVLVQDLKEHFKNYMKEE